MSINANTNRPVLVPEELIIDGELVFTRPVSRTKLTKKRLDKTYKLGAGVLAPFQRVYSVGVRAVDAVNALGAKMGWGELKDFELGDNGPDMWLCHFVADGTSMKAGGRYVPGGCVLDWWQ